MVRDLDAAAGGPREPSLGARWPLPPLPDSLAVERTLGVGARLWEATWLRKAVLLVMLAAAWEVAARLQGNPLLLPTFTETARAFVEALGDGLGAKAWTSVWVLLKGYALGVTLALLLTGLAVSFRLGRDLLGLLTAMLNPLPAIALLPVAMLWLAWARRASSSCWSTRSSGRWRSTRCKASRRCRRRSGWSAATTRSADHVTSP